VAVASSLIAVGLEHVKLAHEHTSAAIEVSPDDGEQVLIGLAVGATAVGINEDGQGSRHADGICKLDQAALAQASRHQGLGDAAARYMPAPIVGCHVWNSKTRVCL